jgi:glycosyltransferase involved in cell wall biosynthesis
MSLQNDKKVSDLSVTCVMITLLTEQRLAWAKRSIADFCRQTLPRKDLVIVHDCGNEEIEAALRAHVTALGRTDIRVVSVGEKMNLGQLRNFSLMQASGDVICQWDDDDRNHPLRLERQLAALVEGDREAVYLRELMQFFPARQTMFWTNWRATEAGGHPGTLMLRRDVPIRYPTEGTTARLGEDLEVARALLKRGRVGYVAGEAHLYIYMSHGANSWDQGHHRMLADTLSISQALLRRREAQLREGLAAHGLEPDVVTLQGSNGPAFVL